MQLKIEEHRRAFRDRIFRTAMPHHPTWFALTGLLVCTHVHADSPAGSSMRLRMRESLKHEFTYKPLPPSPEPPMPDDVILLPELAVEESKYPGSDKVVEEQKQKQQAGLFSWKNGGTIKAWESKHGRRELKFKDNPNGGITFFSISR